MKTTSTRKKRAPFHGIDTETKEKAMEAEQQPDERQKNKQNQKKEEHAGGLKALGKWAI